MTTQYDSTTKVPVSQANTGGAAHVLLAAGTSNIGDVDVLSIAAGDNNIGNVDIVTVPAPLSTAGGGTEAAALRVTLANDSTGLVSVDDNGGSLTVDGSVAALGTGIMVAASVDVNSAIAADVDLAIAAAAGLRLVGFAARESASTAAVATFIILHGTAADGTAVIPVELKADESTREWFGPEGIAVPNGVSIDWIAGTVDVHLFYKTVA